MWAPMAGCFSVQRGGQCHGFELHGLSKFSQVYWELEMLHDGSGEDMGCPKVSLELLLTPLTRRGWQASANLELFRDLV